LSKTLGIEGFPNAEAYRYGVTIPNVNLPRGFIRQTFGLGGEQEVVEDDALHLAGKVDVSRITLTVGKMSVHDIFDNNAYAADPRRQFLNWGTTANLAPATLLSAAGMSVPPSSGKFTLNGQTITVSSTEPWSQLQSDISTATGGAVWWPLEAGRLSLTADIRLPPGRLGQRGKPRAKAGVRRRHAMGLEDVAPAVLSLLEGGLDSLVFRLSHSWR